MFKKIIEKRKDKKERKSLQTLLDMERHMYEYDKEVLKKPEEECHRVRSSLELRLVYFELYGDRITKRILQCFNALDQLEKDISNVKDVDVLYEKYKELLNLEVLDLSNDFFKELEKLYNEEKDFYLKFNLERVINCIYKICDLVVGGIENNEKEENNEVKQNNSNNPKENVKEENNENQNASKKEKKENVKEEKKENVKEEKKENVKEEKKENEEKINFNPTEEELDNSKFSPEFILNEKRLKELLSNNFGLGAKWQKELLKNGKIEFNNEEYNNKFFLFQGGILLVQATSFKDGEVTKLIYSIKENGEIKAQ